MVETGHDRGRRRGYSQRHPPCCGARFGRQGYRRSEVYCRRRGLPGRRSVHRRARSDRPGRHRADRLLWGRADPSLVAAGIDILEVNTVDKPTGARRGKDDRTDAIAAARKVLSGDATAVPKDTTGVRTTLRCRTRADLVRENEPHASTPRRRPSSQQGPPHDRHRQTQNDPKTRDCMTRRQAEGLSPKDITRCLKRYVAREVFQALKTDLDTN